MPNIWFFDELHNARTPTRRDGSLPGQHALDALFPSDPARGGWHRHSDLNVGCASFVLAIRAWWMRWTTEIVVTDRRVIYVQGFFERKSIEVHMNQIESVDVDQTLLGRLFNYGDVTIHGTGTTYEPLRAADRPIALRNEIIAL
jgi:Bacterial PH domain